MRANRRRLLALSLLLAGPLAAQAIPPKAKQAYDQAFAQLREGNVAKALAGYEEALRQAPQAKDIWLEYVVALRKGCRYQQSAKAGWRLLELDPASPGGWGNLGNTFLAAGEWDAAGFAFDKAAALGKDKAAGAQNLLNLGHSLCAAGDAKQALQVFAKAARLDPENGLTWIDAAVAHAMLGNRDKAETSVRQAIALLEKKSDARSEALKQYADLVLEELGKEQPRFPNPPTVYSQQLPKPLTKQPAKGKSAALPIAKEVEHVVRLGDQLFCALRAPENWTLLVNGQGADGESAAPVTLEFHSPEAGRFEVLLTLAAATLTDEELRARVEGTGKQALASAVERSLEVRELQSKTAHGCYFSLQDRDLVGRQPPEGQFAHMTQGILQVGGAMIPFTLLTCDREEKTMAPLLAVLQGIAARAAK